MFGRVVGKREAIQKRASGRLLPKSRLGATLRAAPESGRIGDFVPFPNTYSSFTAETVLRVLCLVGVDDLCWGNACKLNGFPFYFCS
jgi:hypothetical protein